MSLYSKKLLTPPVKKQPIQNILLVEDSPTQASSLKTTLEMNGLSVSVVDDGPEAIEQAHTQAFDLIVLDIELPTLNGYDTCRRLKLDSTTADIPVILFTSRDRSIDTLNGLNLGIVDYIPKDAFAEPTLLNTIRQLNQGNKE